jgi:hypothetical protein
MKQETVIDVFCGGYHRAFLTDTGKYILAGHHHCLPKSAIGGEHYLQENLFDSNCNYYRNKFAAGPNFSFFYQVLENSQEAQRFMSKLYATSKKFVDIDFVWNE